MWEKFLILLPIIPFLGFLINILFGKNLPKTIISFVANLSIFLPLILSVYIFCILKNESNPIYISKIYSWIKIPELQVDFTFSVDKLSAIMLMIVTGVGFLVHIYSIGYMKSDKDYGRYFAYLNLFVAFMLVLVLGSNLLVMFIGWEGVGLASYLLIGFWFKNDEYCKAANKAFIMNRIGDAAFLLAIFLIFKTFGSIEFIDINNSLKAYAYSLTDGVLPNLTIIALLLILAATGKSAQLPLYTWLPDAMAGPTPVSALMHAATMVTAGIYLILKLNLLFVLSPIALSIMAAIGLTTALISAAIACTQNDIKKILAFSTISQLGYMFLALGIGAFSAAFFHLLTHAFFKAVLFLGAGSVIHAIHKQDLGYMGGLRKKMPITFIAMLIAGLALSGIPPLSGFFSKDAILSGIFNISIISWLIAFITSLLTAFYIFRLIFLVFFGDLPKESDIKESGVSMTVPMIVLATFSIAIGFINIPDVLGGRALLSNFLEPVFATSMDVLTISHMSHITEYVIIFIAVLGGLVSIYLAYRKYVVNRSEIYNTESIPGKGGIKRIAYNQFYIDKFYNDVFVRPLNYLSLKIPKFIDKMVIDGIINTITNTIKRIGLQIRFMQSGRVSYYLISMVFFLAVILFFLNYFLTQV